MSIDYFWHVPAADRAGKNWRKFRPGDKDIPSTEHQVFLAHGGNFLIDEMYLFDAPEDARWFFDEGHRATHLCSDGVAEEEAPDHMYLNHQR